MRSKIPISVRFRSGTGKVIRMNKNFTEDTFGQRIKAARVSKGLTQEEQSLMRAMCLLFVLKMKMGK